jgi:hypothetical protein
LWCCRPPALKKFFDADTACGVWRVDVADDGRIVAKLPEFSSQASAGIIEQPRYTLCDTQHPVASGDRERAFEATIGGPRERRNDHDEQCRDEQRKLSPDGQPLGRQAHA